MPEVLPNCTLGQFMGCIYYHLFKIISYCGLNEGFGEQGHPVGFLMWFSKKIGNILQHDYAINIQKLLVSSIPAASQETFANRVFILPTFIEIGGNNSNVTILQMPIAIPLVLASISRAFTGIIKKIIQGIGVEFKFYFIKTPGGGKPIFQAIHRINKLITKPCMPKMNIIIVRIQKSRQEKIGLVLKKMLQ